MRRQIFALVSLSIFIILNGRREKYCNPNLIAVRNQVLAKIEIMIPIIFSLNLT